MNEPDTLNRRRFLKGLLAIGVAISVAESLVREVATKKWHLPHDERIMVIPEAPVELRADFDGVAGVKANVYLMNSSGDQRRRTMSHYFQFTRHGDCIRTSDELTLESDERGRRREQARLIT